MNTNNVSVKQIITLRLLLLLIVAIGFISCEGTSPEEKVIKKALKVYIKSTEKDFKQLISDDGVNNLIIHISDEYLEPADSILHPDYNIYCISYSNKYNDYFGIPSKIFYVDGYPVMLYKKDIPPMDKKNIPKKLYKNKDGNDWEIENDWYLIICKKTYKYELTQNPYIDITRLDPKFRKFFCE